MDKVKVIVTTYFTDAETKLDRKVGSEFECNRERAEFLKSKGVVDIIEETKVENVDNCVDNKEESTENVDKPKRKRKKIEE